MLGVTGPLPLAMPGPGLPSRAGVPDGPCVCPFCTTLTPPFVRPCCVNTVLGEGAGRLGELDLERQRLQGQVAERVLGREKDAAVKHMRQCEQGERRQRVKRRLEEEKQRVAQARAATDKLRLSNAAKSSRLKHAQDVLKQARNDKGLPFGTTLQDKNLLNHLIVSSESQRSQCKLFLRQLKDIFPLRLAMQLPAAEQSLLCAEGVRICGLRLPSSSSLLISLSPEELSTALGCFLQFLDLAAKYLSFQLLHSSGFGASFSCLWLRSSYWSSLPSSFDHRFALHTSRPPLQEGQAQGGMHGPPPRPKAQVGGGRQADDGTPFGSENGDGPWHERVENMGQSGSSAHGPKGAVGDCHIRGHVDPKRNGRASGGAWDASELAPRAPCPSRWSEPVPLPSSLVRADPSSSASSGSLFESPSWHALPGIGSANESREGAAQAQGSWRLGEAEDVRAAHGGPTRGGAAASPWPLRDEDLELCEGLRVLCRSVACLCAAEEARERKRQKWLQQQLQQHQQQHLSLQQQGMLKDGWVEGGKGNGASSLRGEAGAGQSGQGVAGMRQARACAALQRTEYEEEIGSVFTSFCLLLSALTREMRPWNATESRTKSGMLESAVWEEGMFVGPSGRVQPGTAPLADAGKHTPSSSLHSAAFVDPSLRPSRGHLLGSSLLFDYIQPPAADTRRASRAGTEEAQETRQRAHGQGSTVRFLPLFQARVGRGRRRKEGVSLEEEWAVVDDPMLPPPPSDPEAVDHWTRAMFLDATK